jgi:hypothetical protein
VEKAMKDIRKSAAVAAAIEEPLSGLQSFLRPSMFLRPAYLAQSAWLEHLPFAFWLTEAQRPRIIVELGTHYGPSYFAFCQAVRQLGLDTACYAIDTWKGDEHAGFYGEDVFAAVQTYNNSHYSAFSTLVRSSFDDALHHFADGSIDILHIDGHHTYESVRHDFENWRPKLSDQAIVLLHDTNVRERGFGVFRLFDNLKSHHPFFEFVHGHGLGVVGIGGRCKEPVARLFDAEKDRPIRHEVQSVFSKLGIACSDTFAIRSVREQHEMLKARFAEACRQRDAVGDQLSKEQQINAGLRRDIEMQKRQLAILEESAKGEASELQMKIGQLELSIAERFREVALLTRRLAHKDAEASALAKRLGELEQKGIGRRLKKVRRRVLRFVKGRRRSK